MDEIHVESGRQFEDDAIALRYRWQTEEGSKPAIGLDVYRGLMVPWLDAHRDSHRLFVARTGGRTIGVAWWARVDRVPGPGQTTRLGALLQSVYVVPESRDRGVGGQLVARVIDDVRDAGADYLIVHPSERSFDFYRRLGFADAVRALELRFADRATAQNPRRGPSPAPAP